MNFPENEHQTVSGAHYPENIQSSKHELFQRSIITVRVSKIGLSVYICLQDTHIHQLLW